MLLVVTYTGMLEPSRLDWSSSKKEWRCSVRSTTGLERLMWSGNCTPRSLRSRLCIFTQLFEHIPSSCDTTSSRTRSSCLDGYPVHVSPREMGDRKPRRTFKIDVCRPVTLDMRNHALPATVESGIVSYADTCARGVEVVESSWQWGERGMGAVCARGVLPLLFGWSRRRLVQWVFFLRFRV